MAAAKHHRRPPQPSLEQLNKRVGGLARTLKKPAEERVARFGWVALPEQGGAHVELFVIGGKPKRVRISYPPRVGSPAIRFESIAEASLRQTGHRIKLAKPLAEGTRADNGWRMRSADVEIPGDAKPKAATRVG